MSLINIEKWYQTADIKTIERRLDKIMAKLDDVIQGIADFRADTAAEKEQVRTAFENLNTKIDELTELVESGKLDEEKLSQAAADVAAARDEVQNIFTPETEDDDDDGEDGDELP